MKPRISCIIPTLNRGHILLRTVEQLIGQTSAPEIIVVDQTVSPDAATSSVLSGWNDEGRIRLFHQSEPNASKARNAGALEATGDVLLFLDDDIEVGPEFIAAHAKNYLDPKVVAVSGQVLESERAVTTKLQFDPKDPDLGWIRFPKNYAIRCRTSWMASGNFSIRRNVYFEIGGMDENYTRGAFREETDFAMRFLKAGYRFQFDPSASIRHLGVRAVPTGGARSWSQVFCWHHCVGDWYFRLRFANKRTRWPLLWFGFRHLVASRKNVTYPWFLPLAAVCWLAAAPAAIWKRSRGSRLAPAQSGPRLKTEKLSDG